MDVRAKRWSNAAFWAILAVPFVAGDSILAAAHDGVRWPAQAMGIGLLALGVLAARGKLRVTKTTLHRRRNVALRRTGSAIACSFLRSRFHS